MKVFNQLLILALLILSCQNPEQVSVDHSDVSVKQSEVAGTVAKHTAAIVIEGMSCEMACVSSVNKTMTALKGTNHIDISFDADRTLDTCFVDFDENIVNTDDMIEAIESLNGGAYKVKSIEVINAVVKDGSSSTSTSQNVKIGEREQVKYTKFTFPSLLDLIKSVGL